MIDLSRPADTERPFRSPKEAAAYLRTRGYTVSRALGGSWVIGLRGGLSDGELVDRAGRERERAGL